MNARTSSIPERVVPAAGALVWRKQEGELQVLLVHRKRYDDWSWPKGKLDPGESFSQAAVREVFEETGLKVRLGIPLPEMVYALPGGGTKLVRYWAGVAIGGGGDLEFEVDEVRWLNVHDARELLTYPRDKTPLEALVAAEDKGKLETWPFLFVRHAHAIPRSAYRGDNDAERPLSAKGRVRAKTLSSILDAWAPTRVVSSPSTRCVETVQPFVDDHDVPLKVKPSLSEETYETEPDRALRRLDKVIAKGAPVAFCTHRPLIPALALRAAGYAPNDPEGRGLFEHAATAGMDKGEVLVAQMVGKGEDAEIVSVERLRTPSEQR